MADTPADPSGKAALIIAEELLTLLASKGHITQDEMFTTVNTAARKLAHGGMAKAALQADRLNQRLRKLFDPG